MQILDIARASLLKCEQEGLLSPTMKLPNKERSRPLYDFKKLSAYFLYVQLKSDKGYLEKKSYEPLSIVNKLVEDEKSLNAKYLLVFEDKAIFTWTDREFVEAMTSNTDFIGFVDWQAHLQLLIERIETVFPNDDRNDVAQKELVAC